ncbi:trichohyalin-like [Cataglyphis hispanica]|uniref:trichohyalin-like n=1 Tax=Cataglyphis hispanica TaxID=1086592 RepID=UPI00217FC140|nr:trichohyalin-like [Cataglyphis hispanica]
MRNRLYYYISIFVLLVILQPISHAKRVNDTRRAKREASVAEEVSQPRENANYEREVNSEREERSNDDLEKDDQQEKCKISKESANFNVQETNAEKSIASPIASRLNLNEESDYAEEEAGEETAKQESDKDVETSDLKRLTRDINVEKYTDQDERSNLYDDYETKEVAKRGVLDGPADYEEVEDDSPGTLENTVALKERDEGERETRENDSRVKRDQALSETLDKSESSNSAKLEESKLAESPLTDKLSHAESSKNFNRRASASDDSACKMKEPAGTNEMISKSSSSTENKEPANIITSFNEDESSAEYGKRVEEEIQRKIDSIKEEIKRDIEVQRRIKDIEKNNAKFDELRDQEEDEEKLEGEPIEKRQIKRSIQEIVAPSSKRDDKKCCLKGEQRDKLQRRSSEIGRPETLKESEKLKRQSAINRDKFSEGQAPLKGLFKKKRERVRQTFLVNNDRAKRRGSRSYTSLSDRSAARPENELLDINSYHHADDGMLQASSSIAGEDESNDGEQSATMERSNSLASLTGSSQELSPRLARDYKEAFGGLQSEPSGALARFKRIKRVLGGPDAKI